MSPHPNCWGFGASVRGFVFARTKNSSWLSHFTRTHAQASPCSSHAIGNWDRHRATRQNGKQREGGSSKIRICGTAALPQPPFPSLHACWDGCGCDVSPEQDPVKGEAHNHRCHATPLVNVCTRSCQLLLSCSSLRKRTLEWKFRGLRLHALILPPAQVRCGQKQPARSYLNDVTRSKTIRRNTSGGTASDFSSSFWFHMGTGRGPGWSRQHLHLHTDQCAQAGEVYPQHLDVAD